MRVEEIPAADRHLYLDNSLLVVAGEVREIRVSGSTLMSRAVGAIEDLNPMNSLSRAEIVWPEPAMVQYAPRRVCYITRNAYRSARRAPTPSHYMRMWDSAGAGNSMVGLSSSRGIGTALLGQLIQQEAEGVTYTELNAALELLEKPGAIAIEPSLAVQRLRNGMLRVVHRGNGVGRIENGVFLAYAKVPLSARVADKLYKLGGIEWRYQEK